MMKGMVKYRGYRTMASKSPIKGEKNKRKKKRAAYRAELLREMREKKKEDRKRKYHKPAEFGIEYIAED